MDTTAQHTGTSASRPGSLALIAGLVAMTLVAELLPAAGGQGRRSLLRRDPAPDSPSPSPQSDAKAQGGALAHGAAKTESGSAAKPDTTAPDEPVKAATLFEIAKNIVARIGRDNLTLVAAGVAFYAMTAVFPAIAAFVSIYGLFADPGSVQQQLGTLTGLLPADSMKILTDALQAYASKSHSTLNLALVVSVVLALWSAKAGITSMMTGLNIANEQVERRGFILQQVVALALTLGAVVFAMIAISAVAVLPAVIDLLPVGDAVKNVLNLGRWPLLAVLMGLALAVVYRFGPYKENPKWRWISWGAAVGTVLWIVGSALFSFYVSHFGSYDATYGSLAAAVVLLLWFWVSALILLIGAEIDAELEHADGRAPRPLPKGAP